MATTLYTKRKRSVPDATPHTGMGCAMHFSMATASEAPLAADSTAHVAEHVTEKAGSNLVPSPTARNSWAPRTVQAKAVPTSAGWRAKALDMQVLQLAEQLISERKLCEDLKTQASLDRERLEGQIAKVEAARDLSAAEAQLRVEQSEGVNKDLVAKLASLSAELDRLTLAHTELEARHADALRLCHDRHLETQTLKAQLSSLRDKMIREEGNLGTYKRHILLVMKGVQEMSREEAAGKGFKQQLSSYITGGCMRAEDVEIIQQILKAKEEGWQNEMQSMDEMKAMEDRLKREHGAQQADMQARLDAGKVELNELRQQNELHDREAVEHETTLRREKDAALDNFRDLQARHDQLLLSLSQLVVICVDLSGSLSRVILQVKSIYRHILTRIRSTNSTANLAVIVHGIHTPLDLPSQPISEHMISFLDSAWPGCVQVREDYDFCLPKARAILADSTAVRKAVILIGDGGAKGPGYSSDLVAATQACEEMKMSKVPVHSIIIPNGYGPTWATTVRRSTKDFADQTGGQAHTEGTYEEALDEMLAYK